MTGEASKLVSETDETGALTIDSVNLERVQRRPNHVPHDARQATLTFVQGGWSRGVPSLLHGLSMEGSPIIRKRLAVSEEHSCSGSGTSALQEKRTRFRSAGQLSGKLALVAGRIIGDGIESPSPSVPVQELRDTQATPWTPAMDLDNPEVRHGESTLPLPVARRAERAARREMPGTLQVGQPPTPILQGLDSTDVNAGMDDTLKRTGKPVRIPVLPMEGNLVELA